jgi:hypothetical protein
MGEQALNCPQTSRFRTDYCSDFGSQWLPKQRKHTTNRVEFETSLFLRVSLRYHENLKPKFG